MTSLYLDLILASLIAFALGLAPLPSWKVAIGACVFVAVIAWAARAIIIFTDDDMSVAADYVNGLDAGIVAIEISVGFAWSVACFGLGRLAAWAKRRLFDLGRTVV
jgi:hypothetical protein